MIYKHLIIEVKAEDGKALQKYLFKLGYNWQESPGFSGSYRIKHRQLIDFENKFNWLVKVIYVIIGSDNNMTWTKELPNLAFDFDKYKKISYRQLVRKQKLEKIKENDI